MIKISNFKPYYIASVFAIISSLSPAINVFSPISVSNFQIALTILVVIITLKLKLITNTHFIILLCVFSILLIQQVFRGGNSFNFELSVFKFLIIPFIIYYSYLIAKFYKVNFLNTFYIYFIINIIIVYYRSFFDYTFFGILYSNVFEKFADSYVVGEALWRPSNLSSAIVFSVELVIFLFLQYFSESNRRKLLFISIASIVPILVMQSRSSWVILSLGIIFILLKKKKYFFLSLITLFSTYLLFKFEIILKIINLFTFNEESYSTRFNSVYGSIQWFVESPSNKILFGNGTGFANYKNPGTDNFGVYVENFHLSILFDQGLLIFIVWILFNIYCLFRFTRNKNSLSIILFFVLLSNSFSSSLTVFTLQMFYTLIIIIGFNVTKLNKSHV
tara:strand:+ start:4398 stop:5567 length:1170 start_codon:yes stop_codon:yes gene_type:complete